jgi:hypothetical protein
MQLDTRVAMPYQQAASALRVGDIRTAQQLVDNASKTLAPLGVSC